MDIQRDEEFEKAYSEICKPIIARPYPRNEKGEYIYKEIHEAHLMWQAKAQAIPEGFVLVPKDQYESLNEFRGLYKRAIINARKRKDQLNWAHVAGLGVGSGRAVELCKMLNIDPSATNMHEVIEAQEQNHG